MWTDMVDIIQTWADGLDVIIKKTGEEYSYRIVDEPGDWMSGLPKGMVWADARTMFDEAFELSDRTTTQILS